MSSADITLPTVFQTAKVLQTIHMGESQARQEWGCDFFLLFSRIKHRIECGGRIEHETSTNTGTRDFRIRKLRFFHLIMI